MRTTFAILLVLLFGFSLIGPAVAASDAAASTPACCRRGGEHACSQKSGGATPAGPAVQSERCRFYPVAKAMPPARTVCLPAGSQAIFAGLVSQPAPCPQTEAQYRISYSRSRQERGPPSLLS